MYKPYMKNQVEISELVSQGANLTRPMGKWVRIKQGKRQSKEASGGRG
jgi:hypothetical protein